MFDDAGAAFSQPRQRPALKDRIPIGAWRPAEFARGPLRRNRPVFVRRANI
jgi:hypothetical protein